MTNSERRLRLLVAFDDSPAARYALRYLTSKAGLRGTEITIVWAVSDEAMLDPAETRLHQLEQEAAVTNITVGSRIVVGRPVPTILNAARDLDVDMLLIGTDKSSNLDRWLNGSVTYDIARKSPLPVLVVPTGTPTPLDGQQMKQIVVSSEGILFDGRAVRAANLLARAVNVPVVELPTKALVMANGEDSSVIALSTEERSAGTRGGTLSHSLAWHLAAEESVPLLLVGPRVAATRASEARVLE